MIDYDDESSSSSSNESVCTDNHPLTTHETSGTPSYRALMKEHRASLDQIVLPRLTLRDILLNSKKKPHWTPTHHHLMTRHSALHALAKNITASQVQPLLSALCAACADVNIASATGTRHGKFVTDEILRRVAAAVEYNIWTRLRGYVFVERVGFEGRAAVYKAFYPDYMTDADWDGRHDRAQVAELVASLPGKVVEAKLRFLDAGLDVEGHRILSTITAVRDPGTNDISRRKAADRSAVYGLKSHIPFTPTWTSDRTPSAPNAPHLTNILSAHDFLHSKRIQDFFDLISQADPSDQRQCLTDLLSDAGLGSLPSEDHKLRFAHGPAFAYHLRSSKAWNQFTKAAYFDGLNAIKGALGRYSATLRFLRRSSRDAVPGIKREDLAAGEGRGSDLETAREAMLGSGASAKGKGKYPVVEETSSPFDVENVLDYVPEPEELVRYTSWER